MVSTSDQEIIDESTGTDLTAGLSTLSSLSDRLHHIEIELAEKKLVLTEALCENQKLTHQLRQLTSSVNDSDTNLVNNNNNTNNLPVRWLSKTVHTIKEAASSPHRTKAS